MTQTEFTQGKKSRNYRSLHYISLYNAIYPNKKQLTCAQCNQDKYNKLIVGSSSSSIKTSTNVRISHIVNNSKGGNTQYGNFYLGQPLNINYLGRMEGMSGGSGTPPKNNFI
jgi:hypothetical protein